MAGLRFTSHSLRSNELDWGRACILEHDARLKRLMWACCVLVLYLVLHFLIYWYVQPSATQRAEYKAVVSSLYGRIHEPMNQREVAHLVKALEQLRIGGAQPLLGLDFKAAPLNDFLGEDQFDMAATIALLQDNSLRAAKAKLELLATKVTRVQLRTTRLLKILSYVGLTGACLLFCYVLYVGFRLRRHWSDEITVMEAQEFAPLIPKNFIDYLKAVVNEEASFTGHRADVSVLGLQTSELPAALSMVAEQLIEQLVRNAVEHGGRPAEKRVIAGKPDHLMIKVVIKEIDDAYIVAVRDDGEGMNARAVIQRALDLDLINETQANSMPAEQAMRLIFLPGFHSPDRQVSQADNDQSLNELRMLISTLSGVITMQNEPGQYCQFTIKFPKDALPSETVDEA